MSDSDYHESELNRSYELGISAGLEQAASYILEEATAYFRQEQDERARMLRNMATWLTQLAEKAHPGRRSQ